MADRSQGFLGIEQDGPEILRFAHIDFGEVVEDAQARPGPIQLHLAAEILRQFLHLAFIGIEKKLRRRGGNLRKSAVFLTASTVLLTMAVVALIMMLCGLLGRIPLLIAMALLDWMGIAITSMAKEARGVEKALGRFHGRLDYAGVAAIAVQDRPRQESDAHPVSVLHR